MSKENSKKFTLRANKYTFEECAEFAQDCKSGNELRKKSREIYDICFYKNWLPLFTKLRRERCEVFSLAYESPCIILDFLYNV